LAQWHSEPAAGPKEQLRQPGGFEGLGATEPGPRFDALAVAPCEQYGGLLIEVDATGESKPNAAQGEHFVPEVVHLGEPGVALLGDLCQVLEVLTRSCVAAIGPPLGDLFERGRPHAFGVPERDPRFHVAPIPRVN
jgi:hypothetical protein